MNSPAPRFDGQEIFGLTSAFSANRFTPTPADVDLFLGLTPGTTTYAMGLMASIDGAFIGPTVASVQAQQATLLGFAGVVGSFGFPATYNIPYLWDHWKSCTFKASEIVFGGGGIALVNGQYQVSYKMVVRHPFQT